MQAFALLLLAATPAADPAAEPAPDRMQLTFNTRDGDDYLRQLTGLGAILAVRQDNGRYVVYRRLDARPLRGKVEDVSKIDSIYWVDTNPTTVSQLSKIMGYREPPSDIVAFFPREFEAELREKETKFARAHDRPVESIKRTRFVVELVDGKYTVEVAEQTE